MAENGAVVYAPSHGTGILPEQSPPSELIQTLKARQVKPLAIGRVIVATEQPHGQTANALPIVQQQADWVTQGERGAGVRELIDRVPASDPS